MSFTVLRVGSHPTAVLPGAGRAGAVLAADPRYRTVYRAPAWRQDPRPVAEPPPSSGTELRFLPFPLRPLPRRRRPTPLLAWLLAERVAHIHRFCYRVVRDAAAATPDLVHVHSPMYAPVLAWAARRGIPTVLTFHGSEVRVLARSWLLRRAARRARVLLCVAESAAPEIRRLFPDHEVGVAGNGVDLEAFRPEDGAARQPTVLAVGSLRWHKDHATLLRAFAALAPAHPEWRLRLLGGGELRSELEALATELGLCDRVELPGQVKVARLRRELAAAAVFAMSSVTEGLPKALLEAMAAGCACVATDVGDCRTALRGTGAVVAPGDPAALAAALRLLLADPAARARLGAAARDRAADYSWDAYRDRHYDLYTRLLARDAAPAPHP